jgi:hypothetical protein
MPALKRAFDVLDGFEMRFNPLIITLANRRRLGPYSPIPDWPPIDFRNWHNPTSAAGQKSLG